jgi:hypothetical protein
MQDSIFRFMALSHLTLPADFSLHLSSLVLADCRAAIKFAFKLTGFLSALLQSSLSIGITAFASIKPGQSEAMHAA